MIIATVVTRTTNIISVKQLGACLFLVVKIILLKRRTTFFVSPEIDAIEERLTDGMKSSKEHRRVTGYMHQRWPDPPLSEDRQRGEAGGASR